MADPFGDPDDSQIQSWLSEYGTTGLKRYELEAGRNQGAVAWYREMAVTERMLLARAEQINSDFKEAMPEEDEPYDVQRMIVKACLLYPDLEDYPLSPMAALELFGRVRQHGHGALRDDEPHVSSQGRTVSPDEAEEALPEHITYDIKNARESAQKLLTDGRYGSLYFNLCVRLASRGGSPNPQLLWWLMNQPAGKLRDVASLVELAHGTLLESSLKQLQGQDGEAEDKRAEERRMRELFYSPFDVFDEATGQESMPFSDQEEEADDSGASKEEAPDVPEADRDLLPDQPIQSGNEVAQVFD